MEPTSLTVDPQVKPRNKHLPLLIGLVVTLAIAVGFAIYLILPSHVIVPDLRGQTLSDATAKLQAQHLVLGRKTVKGDPTRATIVLSQFPAPAASVSTGSAVDVVLVEAMALRMPSLVGKPLYTAQRKLADAGLQLGSIQWNARSRAARDTVLQQIPTAGVTVQAGATVNLVVSGVPQRATPTAARSTPQSAPAQAAVASGQTANIAGSWRDSGGAVVRIQQNGSTLQYSAHSAVGNCQGNGVMTGTNFQTSYRCASIIGSRSSGRCAGVVSGNGTMFRLNCSDSMMGRTSDVFTR
jgi:hypothetical protein